ncbi:MAG: sulfatase-like hydrolase/transferase [Polyangiaceae bacterium]|nr:sulfatase-like hydrolase/transferase [Polyangiaceae bacterium]
MATPGVYLMGSISNIWPVGLLVLSAACSRKPEPLPSPPAPTRAHTETAPKPLKNADSKPQEATAAAKAPARTPLNVILITIDSLRADMPWTGYARPIAPFLTELAQSSVVYERAYSLSSYTSKSVSSLLTGRYPSTLYRSGSFFASFSPANVFFTEALQAHKIRTIGWHGHMYFGKDKGLNQGFDEWQIVPGITFNSETDEHVTSDKMTALGIQLLTKPENTSGQFFAWAHYMDPHDKYIKHPESPDFGRNNRGRYDSEVYYTDSYLKKFFDWCKTQPWFEHTAIIVSADHGEAFGEHEMYKHAFELWDVLTHVPLIIKVPGVPPKRILARRSILDLAPTILDLMDCPAPTSFMGKSLVPEISGEAPPEERPYILLELPEDSHNAPRRAIIKGAFKLYSRDDSHQLSLYNLDKDPGETVDLAEKDPKTKTELKALLDQAYAAIPRVEPFGGMALRTGRRAAGPTGPTAR